MLVLMVKVARCRQLGLGEQVLSKQAGSANNRYNWPMSTPILVTKLYIPSARPKVVLLSHLAERLNAGLPPQADSAISPPGFGKTPWLVRGWLSAGGEPPGYHWTTRRKSPLAFSITLWLPCRQLRQRLLSRWWGCFTLPRPRRWMACCQFCSSQPLRLGFALLLGCLVLIETIFVPSASERSIRSLSLCRCLVALVDDYGGIHAA
jgi:hypothetical protein